MSDVRLLWAPRSHSFSCVQCVQASTSWFAGASCLCCVLPGSRLFHCRPHSLCVVLKYCWWPYCWLTLTRGFWHSCRSVSSSSSWQGLFWTSKYQLTISQTSRGGEHTHTHTLDNAFTSGEPIDVQYRRRQRADVRLDLWTVTWTYWHWDFKNRLGIIIFDAIVCGTSIMKLIHKLCFLVCRCYLCWVVFFFPQVVKET